MKEHSYIGFLQLYKMSAYLVKLTFEIYIEVERFID